LARNPSYVARRDDLLALVDTDYTRVLDVGCAEGINGGELKRRKPGVSVVGIELDATMASVAATRIDEVLIGDAVQHLQALVERGDRFDVVLLGDILEHLVDPWLALRLTRTLCPHGRVLTSLPNISHYTTILNLAVRGYWPYRDRGIHDRTHLRFFGPRNLPELFEGAGFRVDELRVHYRVLERPSRLNRILEPYLSRLPLLRQPFAFQFLCRLV
jgi:2-polyprenyl-3-methyl-5-hydroxy-6-metoxy-1,4-benzoquinol methylase